MFCNSLNTLCNYLVKNSSIALLGGSFNPPHQGHIEITKLALKHHANFDYVIWLVAMQNPLKPKYDKNILERAELANLLIQKEKITSEKVIISTIEEEIGTSETYFVLKKLSQYFPDVNFTWLMGIDNLEHFSSWNHYEKIPELCKIIIFNRPKYEKMIGIKDLLIRQFSDISFIANANFNFSSTEIREKK